MSRLEERKPWPLFESPTCASEQVCTAITVFPADGEWEARTDASAETRFFHLRTGITSGCHGRLCPGGSDAPGVLFPDDWPLAWIGAAAPSTRNESLTRRQAWGIAFVTAAWLCGRLEHGCCL
jgi:hypothetical protein